MAILEPLYGPPLILPDGTGWNLNHANFNRAQSMLLGERVQTAKQSGRTAASLLIRADVAPPTALWRDGRKLRFVGQGRVFRLTRLRAAARGARDVFDVGAKVRLAYYA